MSIRDRVWGLLSLALAFAFISSAPVLAADEEEEDEGPTIEKMVEDMEAKEGLFPLYQDPETGDLMMEISADQIGKEFIYTTQTVDGAPYSSFLHIRGAYLSQNIIKFERRYDKIEIVKQVTSLYFDPDNAISRAADANVIPATLAVLEIAAESDDGRILVDLGSILLSEELQQITPSPNPNMPPNMIPFVLGGLNPQKSGIEEVRDYPENADVIVKYSYDNPQPMNPGGPEVADARNVSITMQHSFLAMPPEGFTPRATDYRVGYFAEEVNDMTTSDPTPYRDVINRWRLEKADPEAELSEPVKPITFWIENTTPEDIREDVKAGVLTWNQAFEKAGFKNAIQVKVQPDDATWEASDIRYNVLRWIASDQIGYAGYGPSFTNPRTGEILGADIMLNYTTWTYRALQERVFKEGDMEAYLAQIDQFDPELCQIGQSVQQNLLFALAVVPGAASDPAFRAELVSQSIRETTAHEVGHTLGLMHNFKGSQMLTPEELNNKEITSKRGVSGSIMDYTIINVAATPAEQGEYFFGNIGPYDLWAIEYGYTPALEDPEAEAARIKALLDRSTENGLAFGNDADNTYSPGLGVDPRVQTFDMSSDAIGYSQNRIGLINRRLKTLMDDYEIEGDSWQNLSQAYRTLWIQKYVSGITVSRYIGGIYVERADREQPGAAQPLTPVPLADQKRAMQVLADNIFAPGSFDLPADLVRHMQLEPRGFNFFGATEDPKLHDQALVTQALALRHILHPVTMKRMSDTALYGNEYTPVEVVNDLTDAVFKADLRTSVSSERQNLQLYYTQQLMAISFGMLGHDMIAQSAADYNLRRIEHMMRQARRPDAATDAHRRRVLAMTESMLYGFPSRN
ncbi:MAG: DUF5117 domain-containing protein [Alphaproteobacteria bacterium]|nr:MAG: DUF5117 domain-containing protein [Alphaproteobacteria bacterium]